MKYIWGAPLCVLKSQSNRNGRSIECTRVGLCTTVCVHVGILLCVDALWCFMIETDSSSHFMLKYCLLLPLNSKVSLLREVTLPLNNV